MRKKPLKTERKCCPDRSACRRPNHTKFSVTAPEFLVKQGNDALYDRATNRFWAKPFLTGEASRHQLLHRWFSQSTIVFPINQCFRCDLPNSVGLETI